jgi:hypothetical protein
MVDAGDLEVLYRNAGYLRYERTYKIIYMHNDYLVVCPEFRSGEKGVEPIVIIPEFLIPGRPYQVEVYLFAIDIYSAFPEKGQRWAAKETRKRFKRKTFSYTTLGRALKRFAGRLMDTEAKIGADTEQLSIDDGTSGFKRSGIATVKETSSLRKYAVRLLRGKATQEDRKSAIAICHEIARNWFEKYQQFLL